MEPITESARAAAELDADIDDLQLLDELRTHSDRVTGLVPDCIGMSVARRDLGVTLTLVSTTREAAILDALQYLDSGPCLEAADRGQVLGFTAEELLSEASWQLFSLAATSAGVASTLTLPVIVDGAVTGTVNLYATTPHAFDGHHQELAGILGAWAAGATTNADLSFSTLGTARQAPRVLADKALIETATGFIMAVAEVSADEAYQRLGDAARRAGVSEVQVAQGVLAAGRNHATWPGGLA
jgi:GAF domain-containing protein